MDYLVVLDFEATCNKGPWKPQEIIEIPAHIVVCKGDKKELDGTEFHCYVRPLANPKLTDFCTELTGIAQSTVDAAEPFAFCYGQLVQFIKDTIPAGSTWAFVTCGDWDFNTCFPNQLDYTFGKDDQSRPGWTWINVKDLFGLLYPAKRKKCGMVGMLAELGLELVGRHHSGIDDTRNIARILRTVLERIDPDTDMTRFVKTQSLAKKAPRQ